MTKPNYELLKYAYSIIDGIPDKNINLSRFYSENSKNISCGTIACAAGFLSLHPKFQELGLIAMHPTLPRFNDRVGIDAMALLFNISKRDSLNLFEQKDFSHYDYFQTRSMSDKQLFLYRVRCFLQKEKVN